MNLNYRTIDYELIELKQIVVGTKTLVRLGSTVITISVIDLKLISQQCISAYGTWHKKMRAFRLTHLHRLIGNPIRLR